MEEEKKEENMGCAIILVIIAIIFVIGAIAGSTNTPTQQTQAVIATEETQTVAVETTPTEETIINIVKSQGYQLDGVFYVAPSAGGVIARNVGGIKNGEKYSIYVELDSNGKAVAWDVVSVNQALRDGIENLK